MRGAHVEPEFGVSVDPSAGDAATSKRKQTASSSSRSSGAAEIGVHFIKKV
jgi:hypothetical protein